MWSRALSWRLAQRARSVLAIDVYPEMIRVPRTHHGSPRIEYRVADVETIELAPASFDLVMSVATLHHVSLKPAIARLAELRK